MKYRLLFLLVLLLSLGGNATPLVLARIEDPVADDNVGSAIIDPQGAHFQAGDLDLRQLEISRDAEGFWFEAVFQNPVRDPKHVAGTVGSDSLADFARRGFYQFNIDIYIDTNRVGGSGGDFTLPGRKARIDAGYAWEKAVILTPRPELMREQLIGALAEQYPDKTAADIQAAVDQDVFFPSRIKVRGRSVRYFVPAGFFGESDGGNWAVTALITGALMSIPANFSLDKSGRKLLDDLVLGVMQPATGRRGGEFGQAIPVVDILGVAGAQQARQLAGKEPLTGVSWGVRAGTAGTPEITVHTSVSSLARLLQPDGGVAASPGTAMQSFSGADGSIARRIQALQQLLDQNLIDEAEYKQQKQRILNEL